MEDNNDKPVDVNSDITPTTKEKIQLIESDSWDSMSVMALYEQLYTLQNRLMFAFSIKNIPIATQLQKGVDKLQSIIDEKLKR